MYKEKLVKLFSPSVKKKKHFIVIASLAILPKGAGWELGINDFVLCAAVYLVYNCVSAFL